MGLFDKIFGRKKEPEKVEIQNARQINPNEIWFTLPTISNEFPQTSGSSNTSEFDIQIHEDDYRQNEFLNASSMPLIEQEIAGIKNIWENFSKKGEDYTIFKNCHVRSFIGEPNLKVNFSELKSALNFQSFGVVKINNETLLDSFTFKTKNTTYYGTSINGIITQFCISQWNENTLEEILMINKSYNLVFVNWYNYDVITKN